MAKKKILTPQDVVAAYMDYVLAHQERPKNVGLFAKEIGLKEAEFYNYFAAFEDLEKHIFSSFFTNVQALLVKDENYVLYDAKGKLLAFYFTFFETLTANRSFVLFALNKHKYSLEALKTLEPLRKLFMAHIDTLDLPAPNLGHAIIDGLKNQTLAGMAWAQFLITLKFWMDDTSAGFEKTDIFIEKSLNASFELLAIRPLESLVDLGKFLFKEKVSNKN